MKNKILSLCIIAIVLTSCGHNSDSKNDHAVDPVISHGEDELKNCSIKFLKSDTLEELALKGFQIRTQCHVDSEEILQRKVSQDIGY